MSMDLMVRAMKAKVGSPMRKLVLIKLADNANDAGECWPSYAHIAEACEVSRETVKTHIRALEKAGLVRREYRKDGDTNRSNLFHLNLRDPWSGADRPPGQELTAPRSGADRPPGQELTPEPVNKNQSREVGDTSDSLGPVKLDLSVLPGDLSSLVWSDWIKHRRAKKCPINTQTVVNTIARELEKARAAGWKPDDAIAEAMAAGWQGVKAEWLANRTAGNVTPIRQRNEL